MQSLDISPTNISHSYDRDSFLTAPGSLLFAHAPRSHNGVTMARGSATKQPDRRRYRLVVMGISSQWPSSYNVRTCYLHAQKLWGYGGYAPTFWSGAPYALGLLQSVPDLRQPAPLDRLAVGLLILYQHANA